MTSYNDAAVDATVEAVRHERDFAGRVASVLSAAAAELGSTHALISGRLGAWEADLVHRLVGGTVGYDDEYLTDYRRTRPTA